MSVLATVVQRRCTMMMRVLLRGVMVMLVVVGHRWARMKIGVLLRQLLVGTILCRVVLGSRRATVATRLQVLHASHVDDRRRLATQVQHDDMWVVVIRIICVATAACGLVRFPSLLPVLVLTGMRLESLLLVVLLLVVAAAAAGLDIVADLPAAARCPRDHDRRMWSMNRRGARWQMLRLLLR